SESLEVYLAVLRLALPDVGLVLSTREPAGIRRRLLPYGVTQMSAGSVTVPGGYGSGEADGAPFHVADPRAGAQVVEGLASHGFRPAWTAAEAWPGERPGRGPGGRLRWPVEPPRRPAADPLLGSSAPAAPLPVDPAAELPEI